MGWSPMCGNQIKENTTLKNISKKYPDKSTAQVNILLSCISILKIEIMIRWSLQMGVITIPKSQNPERIKQNCDVFDFELDSEDLKMIASLNKELCLQHKCYSIPWQDVPWNLIAEIPFDAFGYLEKHRKR